MSHTFDYLIIGSGIAGLTFALSVADSGSVAIVTKRRKDESATSVAQGGIAAVIDELDSFESHAQDTIRSGAGLCDENVVKTIIGEGPEQIARLVNWGVHFTRGEKLSLDLTKEGGHTHRRVIHAGDITGKEIEYSLLKALSSHPNVMIYENHLAIDLIRSPESKCLGAYV